jgi:hypothetical protein
MDHPTVPPIPAANRAEEAALLGALRCACGARLKFRNLRHRNLRDRRHYDWLRADCSACGAASEVLFDIPGWFRPWVLRGGVVAFGLIGILALGAATILPGMSDGDRRNGLVAAPFGFAMAGFCLWGLRSVRTLDYPVPAAARPPLEGEEAAMASALQALGIPLDFTASDPATALTGGMAKAGLWQGIRRLEAGDAAGARTAFATVLSGLERETDPRWEPVRAAARALAERAGR